MNRTIELTPERVTRFWAKVDRRGPDECWLWTGEVHTCGYGVYSEWSHNRRSLRFLAHRLALLIAGHDITGMVARHSCDNPPCVNPEHLRTGTQADNIQDAVDRGRMDMSGLVAWQSPVWPPRPCRDCGVILTESRKRLCEPCRVEGRRESYRRWAAKNSLTPRRKSLHERHEEAS